MIPEIIGATKIPDLCKERKRVEHSKWEPESLKFLGACVLPLNYTTVRGEPSCRSELSFVRSKGSVVPVITIAVLGC